MTREGILDRVAKLLSLGNSDNEHESALAIARAQALMAEHDITEAMVAESETDEETELDEDIVDASSPITAARARWRGQLAQAIAKANGCGVYRSGVHYKVYGRPSAIERSRYVFDYCNAEIERLASLKRGEGRTWLNNYRLGMVQAIRTAIAAERAGMIDRMRATACDSSALVVVNNAVARVEKEQVEVKAWGRKELGLRSASGSASTYHSGANAAGRRAGAGIYSGAHGARGAIGGGAKRIGG